MSGFTPAKVPGRVTWRELIAENDLFRARVQGIDAIVERRTQLLTGELDEMRMQRDMFLEEVAALHKRDDSIPECEGCDGTGITVATIPYPSDAITPREDSRELPCEDCCGTTKRWVS